MSACFQLEYKTGLGIVPLIYLILRVVYQFATNLDACNRAYIPFSSIIKEPVYNSRAIPFSQVSHVLPVDCGLAAMYTTPRSEYSMRQLIIAIVQLWESTAVISVWLSALYGRISQERTQSERYLAGHIPGGPFFFLGAFLPRDQSLDRLSATLLGSERMRFTLLCAPAGPPPPHPMRSDAARILA
jgi:hypothetical protein